MRHLRSAIAMAAIATGLATSVSLAAPAAATALAAAATPYTFSFIEFANDFTGTGPANSSFTVAVFHGATQIDSTLASTDGSGRFQTFFSGLGRMKPGWKLKAIKNTAVVRSLTIPNVTVAANRVTDAVSGIAPAHRKVRVRAFDCTMDEACSLVATRTPTAAANGHYGLDLTSSFDIHGNDRLLTRYVTPQGDHVTAQTTTAAFGADPSVPEAFGCVDAGHNTTLRLFASPGGTLLEKHTVGGDCFDRVFAADFTAGRQLTADFATDARITLPDTSVTDVGTTVTVHCLPSRPVLVEWFTDTTHHLAGTTDASGLFVRDFASEDPTVNPGSLEVHIQCETSKGDRLEFRRTLPA